MFILQETIAVILKGKIIIVYSKLILFSHIACFSYQSENALAAFVCTLVG
jgi:hypothetical protein